MYICSRSMEGKGSRKKLQSNLLLSLMSFIFFNENKVRYWTIACQRLFFIDFWEKS